MLLGGSIVKLCDLGSSALMYEIFYPSAISIRWSSPDRLGSNPECNPRPLIPEDDIYVSRVTVRVREEPFGLYISEEEDFELWDTIVAGARLDMERIHVSPIVWGSKNARMWLHDHSTTRFGEAGVDSENDRPGGLSSVRVVVHGNMNNKIWVELHINSK